MVKEYIYVNEKGSEIPNSYFEHLNDIFTQEELIKEMENIIKELEQKSNYYKKTNKKHFYPNTTFAVISALMVTCIFLYFVGINGTTTTIFGEIPEIILITMIPTTILMPLGIIADFLVEYPKYKKEKKEEMGNNSKLDYLKQQIVIEKEKLNRLLNDKTKNNENKKFRVVEVKELDKTNELISRLNLFFDLGYNGEKYFEYYQQGELDDILRNHYTEEEIEIAKSYFNKKAPSLTRRR